MLRGLISQRESQDAHGASIDILESSYIKYFENLGVLLQPVSNYITDVNYLFKMNPVNIVILTGGGDVATEYYFDNKEGEQQPNRDMIEKGLIKAAAYYNIPIVGICRGMQFLNGFYGGKISNLAELNIDRPNGQDHMVETCKGQVKVNNYHNDGVLLNNLSSRLSVFALNAEHDIVEGFFSNPDKVLGIQWHPERSFEDQGGYEYSEDLIKEFILNGGKLDESHNLSGRTRD